jgi:DNA-binding MarR family transcriptional regulator
MKLLDAGPRTSRAAIKPQALPEAWRQPASHASALAFEEFPGFLLGRALARIHRIATLPLLARHGLSLAEWRTMSVVATHGDIASADIVGRSTMDKSQISRAVASLEARGLVALRADPAHGRRRLITLTRQGHQLFKKLFPDAQRRQCAVLDQLTQEERRYLFVALKKISVVAPTGIEPVSAP